ncbi:tubulin binding cofactor a protein [Cystoisospora suis]|uniref:Tubulin-specific chaperone A n=1 Tax=Cystoisospora suis TaxID=483139 RepID=A0A2C6KJ77_9APIC|nr:tubulin binding cofactor a protein [Cystoisospora suis]
MATLAGSEYVRFLRIKHKVIQRLTKELKSYQLEVEQHKATVARMKAERREPSDIKQQQNVLDETVIMVPDAEQRLLKACVELDDYMLSNASCMASVQRALARPLDAGSGDSRPALIAPAECDRGASESGESVQQSLDKEVEGIVTTLKSLEDELPHLQIVLKALDSTGTQECASSASESDDEEV